MSKASGGGCKVAKCGGGGQRWRANRSSLLDLPAMTAAKDYHVELLPLGPVHVLADRPIDVWVPGHDTGNGAVKTVTWGWGVRNSLPTRRQLRTHTTGMSYCSRSLANRTLKVTVPWRDRDKVLTSMGSIRHMPRQERALMMVVVHAAIAPVVYRFRWLAIFDCNVLSVHASLYKDSARGDCFNMLTSSLLGRVDHGSAS